MESKHQQDMLFREMLKSTDNFKIKEFYKKQLLNSVSQDQDLDSLMKKFKEKFEMLEKCEWKKSIEVFKNFSWKSEESTENALDRLEEVRTRWSKINMQSNIDKMFIMMFIK